MVKKKLKVAWICHFSNPEIRKRLPLSKMRVKNFLKSLLGKETVNHYADFAPWVNNLIKEFEQFDNIELHVVSPFLGLKHFTSEFEMNGIFYHFFKPDIPIIHATLPEFIHRGSKSQFALNRYLVKKYLERISPDIVNLIGTENPYYSITSLDIKDIPVYVSAQTVYTNPVRKKYSDSCIQLNWDIELMIHKKEKYYGCVGRMHRDLILANNPDAIIFKMFFPLEKTAQVKKLPKIYDFVFFAAGVAKKKGVEDAIDALALVKQKKENVSLNIVGNCPSSYKAFLQRKIIDLDLAENIVFTDYFPVHADMHQHIVQSYFALLPVKFDIIPSALIEAIQLDLPVVTYKTSGTPYLTSHNESILIANIGDIDELARQMLRLLTSESLANKLKQNAKSFVEQTFDNTTSAKRLVSNYYSVIDHYRNNKPIPKEQLFSTKEFPLYGE